MIDLLEDPHNPGMVNAGNEHGQEIREKGRLLLEVKREGFVVSAYGNSANPTSR